MFIEYLEEDRETVENARFYDKLRSKSNSDITPSIEAEEEWLAKDLVVDTRETWKRWSWRQLNFEDPPMIPREDLPE